MPRGAVVGQVQTTTNDWRKSSSCSAWPGWFFSIFLEESLIHVSLVISTFCDCQRKVSTEVSKLWWRASDGRRRWTFTDWTLAFTILFDSEIFFLFSQFEGWTLVPWSQRTTIQNCGAKSVSGLTKFWNAANSAPCKPVWALLQDVPSGRCWKSDHVDRSSHHDSAGSLSELYAFR